MLAAMRLFALFFCLLLPAAVFADAPKDTSLDALFQSLKHAASPEEAGPLEERIIARFRQSGSPSADLLLTRAEALYGAGDKYDAKKLIAAVTGINPGFAEGWHVRALMLANDGDDRGAMVSLQKAVALNPRHFAAMVRLGDMLEEYGDKTKALELFRRALGLDPQYDGLERRVEALTRNVEGQGI
jgi:tetratricopeptide (TPR) repeat protein